MHIFEFDQSLFVIHDSPPYFWDQGGWPPTETCMVSHARDHWRTLDFANAFVFPGVNSRAELVPSRRGLTPGTALRAVGLGINKCMLYYIIAMRYVK
jgi:hypothetical protein